MHVNPNICDNFYPSILLPAAIIITIELQSLDYQSPQACSKLTAQNILHIFVIQT